MAHQQIIPGIGFVNDSEQGNEQIIPGIGFVNESAAAEPPTPFSPFWIPTTYIQYLQGIS